MTDIARLALEVDATSVKSAGIELDRMSRTARDTGQAVDRMSREASGGFTLLQKSVAGLAAALGSIKLASLASEAASLSQRYDQLGIVMHAVGRNAGLAASEVDKAAQAVQKSGIAMNESRAVVARLITAQIDLSKAARLARAAQDAAVIGQINSSEALERMVHGITAAQVEVLRNIGINVNFENSYKALAAQLGKTTTELSENEKMQARVNVVLEESTKNTGVYEASLANADKQLGSTDRLVQDLMTKVGGLFDSAALLAVTNYKKGLEDLNKQVDTLVSSGTIQQWGDSLARSFAIAADNAGILYRSVSVLAEGNLRQKLKLLRGDLSGALEEWKDMLSSLGDISSTKFQDQLSEQIFRRNIKAAQSFNWLHEIPDVMQAAGEATEKLAGSTGKLSDSAKKAMSDRARFIDAIKKEVAELGKSRFEILRMEAARVGASKATAADIDLLEREEERLKILREEQEEWNQAKRESESIINQLLTPQEKLIQQYERMQELAGMNLLSDDQMLQSLTKMQSELFRVGETGRNSFGNLDQFAVQAARNIQTAFADALSGIGGGMQDMLSGLGNSLKRLLAEFAAMKITQSLGIGSLFGVGSSAAMASSGGSGGLDILSVANLGSTVASAFSTGLGTTGLVGSAVTSLGQAFGSSAITAFGQGMSGTAFASANAAAGTMGSAFASVAGPAIALFAVDQIGRLLAGNKSTGTFVDSVPVIGGFAGALFGRGPMKQRETDMAFRITGDEIFEGATSTRFRAKGGLFRSNKNKHVITDFEDAANRELSDLIEGSTKGFASVLREAARNLSLDIERINQFNEVFTLQSPVGEWFSEEQIAGVIADIGERMSNQLLPGLEQFARGGETAFQTISRLNSEFSVLADASLILGRSVAESRAMVSALSFDQRSGFIEAAGGMDALAQKAQFFADNFLDDAERLQPAIEMLDEQMAALGLSSALTKEQFKDLVQSYGQFGGISDELLHSLLNIAPLFARVKDGLAALNPALDESANAARALAAAEQLIIDKRSALTAAYQREHAELSRIADRFSSLAMNLRNASDQLALSELSPLTPEQRLAEARSQVQRDWDAGIAGDEAAQNRFAESIRNFVQASQVFNASSAEFVADYEWAQGMLNSGAIAAESAADIARRELSYLESSVSHLTNISTDVGSIESLMRELVDATLHGPGNAGISGDMIREFLSAPGRTPQETVQAIVQHGVSGKQISDALKVDPSTINQAVAQHFSITDKQIRDYVYTPGRTEQEIYQAAISNGISSARLAGAIGMPQSEILEIAKRNGWAAFERGTDLIPRTGFAMLHKGEAVTPATHMEKMAAEIRELKEIVAGLLREISHKTGSVVGAVLESSKTNARMIIENNQDMAKSLAWREQTRAHMR